MPMPPPMSRSRCAALRPEPRSTRLKQPERWTSTLISFCGPVSWNWVQPDGSSPSITDTVPSLRRQCGTSFIIACWVRCVPDGRACADGWRRKREREAVERRRPEVRLESCANPPIRVAHSVNPNSPRGEWPLPPRADSPSRSASAPAQMTDIDQDPQFQHHRPHRPRQVDARRPADPGDRRPDRPRDERQRAGARQHGHRARARDHHQGADRAARVERATSST